MRLSTTTVLSYLALQGQKNYAGSNKVVLVLRKVALADPWIVIATTQGSAQATLHSTRTSSVHALKNLRWHPQNDFSGCRLNKRIFAMQTLDHEK